MKRRHKLKITLIIATAILTACGLLETSSPRTEPLPPIDIALNCLPESAAFIASHRATSKDSRFAENSSTGLEALIKRGFYFAEIDVARLKDKTHILMHDGVLERTTVGKGAVVSKTWQEAETILLRDPSGRVTSDTIPRFEDILKLADQKIYLEIDFKTSASYQHVIRLIKKHDMQNHVILIAYSKSQATKLNRLAPDMFISVPIIKSRDLKELLEAGIKSEKIGAWISKRELPDSLSNIFQNKNIAVIRKAPTTNVTQAAKEATILVDDYAFQLKPIMGLSRQARREFVLCMTPQTSNNLAAP